MKFYRFSGQDGSSDNGYFEIVVHAKNKRKAEQLARAYLIAQNRSDLLCAVHPVEELRLNNGILYDTIQSKG